ncbi:hypothetical protein [Metallosphaera cuprina]|uniref:Uncharacterized protein n=1 Tax=Metallosphaera cuprina (strain Ar-4) TaxID=1006006 RepID=F4G2X6_METCR|nr:hypothetical protein [Metallosphaera cuprina]AEB95174.1 conserved hypothetical protein [Metallosphaera cuprina Ar-4]
MAGQIDVVQIARLSERERESTMRSLFQQLLALNDDQKLSTLKGLVKEMGEKANDEEYINLCKTNMKLASTLSDDMLKVFLKIRLQASAELPKNIHDRDMNMINRALALVEPSIREKIQRNMPS